MGMRIQSSIGLPAVAKDGSGQRSQSGHEKQSGSSRDKEKGHQGKPRCSKREATLRQKSANRLDVSSEFIHLESAQQIAISTQELLKKLKHLSEEDQKKSSRAQPSTSSTDDFEALQRELALLDKRLRESTARLNQPPLDFSQIGVHTPQPKLRPTLRDLDQAVAKLDHFQGLVGTMQENFKERMEECRRDASGSTNSAANPGSWSQETALRTLDSSYGCILKQAMTSKEVNKVIAKDLALKLLD